jgi:hypothetical protein
MRNAKNSAQECPPDSRIEAMLRIIGTIIRFYFLMVFVYMICIFIAGPKNAALWFVIVSLTLGGLTVYGMILRHRQR